MILRTGLSNKVNSVLLGLEEAQIQRYITSVQNALMNDFVPLHLGFEHISHNEFCRNHTTETASKLFGTNISDSIIFLDGIYLYIQKNTDYSFQRRSYSKNWPLLKPMMIVGIDGYTFDALDLFCRMTQHQPNTCYLQMTVPKLGFRKTITLR